MTTTQTVTDSQIEALRDEAAAAGDTFQVEICERALLSDYAPDGASRLMGALSQDEARQRCAQAISDAAAQDDSTEAI